MLGTLASPSLPHDLVCLILFNLPLHKLIQLKQINKLWLQACKHVLTSDFWIFGKRTHDELHNLLRNNNYDVHYDCPLEHIEYMVSTYTFSFPFHALFVGTGKVSFYNTFDYGGLRQLKDFIPESTLAQDIKEAYDSRQRDCDLLLIHDLQVVREDNNLIITKICVETRDGIFTTLQSLWIHLMSKISAVDRNSNYTDTSCDIGFLESFSPCLKFGNTYVGAIHDSNGEGVECCDGFIRVTLEDLFLNIGERLKKNIRASICNVSDSSFFPKS